MCCGSHRFPAEDEPKLPTTDRRRESTAAVNNLRDRLAETEARLQRARAREAELSNQLEEMKRFVSVMEILENYFKRRFLEQRNQLSLLLPPVP